MFVKFLQQKFDKPFKKRNLKTKIFRNLRYLIYPIMINYFRLRGEVFLFLQPLTDNWVTDRWNNFFYSIFIPHFYSQFHDVKSFLFVPRQISNILYLAPFIFRGFSYKKFAHFSIRLNWINLYIQPPCVIIWDNMFFVVIFTFLVCFRFKFKF